MTKAAENSRKKLSRVRIQKRRKKSAATRDAIDAAIPERIVTLDRASRERAGRAPIFTPGGERKFARLLAG